MARSAWNPDRTRASCAMRARSFSPCSTAEIERCSLFMMVIASFMVSLLETENGLLDAVGDAPGAEADEQQSACAPQLQRAAKPGGEHAGRQQPGQRAGAERGHGDGALRRTAGEHRGEQ